MPLRDCNWGFQGKEIVIVEGIFDALKLRKLTEKGVLVVFGKRMSGVQKLMLMRGEWNRVWVMLDMDAWADTIKMTQELSSLLYCPVIPVFPDLIDPGDYTSNVQLDFLFRDALNYMVN